MSFYSVVQKFADRTDAEMGLHVVEFVLQNRKDNNRAYRSGEVMDFRNKEMNRVHGGLVQLGERWRDPPSPKSLEERFADNPLGKYSQITKVCYCFDVVKGAFQSSNDPIQERLFDVSVFIFERLRRTSVSKPDQLSDYQWEKETVRQEYLRILASMKNALHERTGIIYELHR